MLKRILVALDGSELAERALPVATDIANRTGATLRVVRVHQPIVPFTSIGDFGPALYNPEWDVQAREAEQSYLRRVEAGLRAKCTNPVETSHPTGTAVAETLDGVASAFDADLIVMTTHGHGGAALAWLGSVADAVVRSTRRPVLLIPEKAADKSFAPDRILIAHDGSPQANVACDSAMPLARAYGATVRLVRVVAPPLAGDVMAALSSEGLDRFGIDRLAEMAKAEVDETAARLREGGHTVESVVVIDSNPARAILEEARTSEAGLLVATTSGRGLSRVFVGSVADKLVRSSGIPTLVQRVPATDES